MFIPSTPQPRASGLLTLQVVFLAEPHQHLVLLHTTVVGGEEGVGAVHDHPADGGYSGLQPGEDSVQCKTKVLTENFSKQTMKNKTLVCVTNKLRHSKDASRRHEYRAQRTYTYLCVSGHSVGDPVPDSRRAYPGGHSDTCLTVHRQGFATH